jgi:hypothetical protein
MHVPYGAFFINKEFEFEFELIKKPAIFQKINTRKYKEKK